MDEYASILLMFGCATAMTFPRIMVSAAITQIPSTQRGCRVGNAVRKIRNSTAKPAALGPTDMNPVTGDGAPSYTSGVHMWNGATATLKHSAIRINAADRYASVIWMCGPFRAVWIAFRFVLPAAPKIKAVP